MFCYKCHKPNRDLDFALPLLHSPSASYSPLREQGEVKSEV